ncbi:MAG: hypothetical protein ABIP30_00245 [Ferruginibacter sp.]
MAKVISIKPYAASSPGPDIITDEIKKTEALLKDFPRREAYYNRLMILYRKVKNYKKELALIEKGIKIFQEIMQPKKMPGKQVLAISKKINRAFGLVDSNGNTVHVPEPLLKWQKRKVVVLKKLSQE